MESGNKEEDEGKESEWNPGLDKKVQELDKKIEDYELCKKIQDLHSASINMTKEYSKTNCIDNLNADMTSHAVMQSHKLPQIETIPPTQLRNLWSA